MVLQNRRKLEVQYMVLQNRRKLEVQYMVLQNRWKLEGKYLIYFGLRRFPYTNKNKIRVSRKERKILALKEIPATKRIKRFVKEGIVVDPSQLKKTPKNMDEARFCSACAANDFIIAGIEFDENGLCPMCAAKQRDKNIVSVLPIKSTIAPAKHSRFDVAVFYTGGKDSTYILHYLARVLNLRVLALTWQIPFMSQSARQSILNAKKHFKNVEFVARTVAPQDLNRLYKKLLSLQNNTCACPSLAYAIFYPILCQERIPYLVLGNEPVQMKQLYYNNIAPRIAYHHKGLKSVHIILNILRLIVLKKPLRQGQREMLLLVKQLAYGDGFLKRMAGYKNELISNVCLAMDEISNLKSSLKKTIKFSDRRAQMPSLIHLDMNALSGGNYNWSEIKKMLSSECGWVAPKSQNKNLHTSCAIENAKDYSQFVRFYNMQSTMIPFSALEIALASSSGNITKEQAVAEMKESAGFSFIPPKEYDLMASCEGCPVEQCHDK